MVVPGEVGYLRHGLPGVPPFICQLKSLEEVNCANCSMLFIRRDIGALKNLRKLNLSNNDITHLPPTIGCLENLEELDLSGCDICELPPEIGDLENLETLDLDRTKQLTFIPEEFLRLENLKKLQISSNDYLENCTSEDVLGRIYYLIMRCQG